MNTKKENNKKKNTISNNLPNNNKVVNISSYLDKNNNIILSQEDNGYFTLPFYMDNSIFLNDSEYNRFIKDVEKMVRTSDYYKEYISILKLQYGLNYCMILGNIDDDEDVHIEMHHGPLMTLYDVVSLIVNDSMANNKQISTFKVTDMVLKEHYEHNIQVIMLSKTVHELVHKGKIFISPKQCFGNINNLLTKYKKGITYELATGINKYLELSKKYDTNDNDLLATNTITSWNKTNDELII